MKPPLPISDATRPGSIAQPLLVHVPGYLAPGEADALLRWALAEPSWQAETIALFGRRITVPRLVAWFGDPRVRYRYSGVDHEAGGWPAPLAELRMRLGKDFGVRSNFVLLNRYRDGRDSMGWHADDEPQLEGPVLSVSVGETRILRLRAGRRGPALKLALGHGALLVHERGCFHALPKTQQRVGERVNLTFRRVRVA